MIITIDGPAGAGKSAVAQRLAQSLGFKHLDTGAMYRAVALAALEEGLDGDPDGLARWVGQIQVSFDWSNEPPRVRLDGRDVTDAIRTPRVTQATHLAAGNPQVRAVLVEQQRRIAAAAGSLVTEGRDQGTVVFPTAEYKFYLDASLQERARRRAVQWRDQGRAVTLDSLATQLQQRDDRDRNRGVGSLTIPPGAIVIDTTPLTLQEVVELMRRTVQGQPRVSYTYRGEGTGWFQTLLWTVGRFLLQTIAILFFRVRITGRENIPRRGAAGHQPSKPSGSVAYRHRPGATNPLPGPRKPVSRRLCPIRFRTHERISYPPRPGGYDGDPRGHRPAAARISGEYFSRSHPDHRWHHRSDCRWPGGDHTSGQGALDSGGNRRGV